MSKLVHHAVIARSGRSWERKRGRTRQSRKSIIVRVGLTLLALSACPARAAEIPISPPSGAASDPLSIVTFTDLRGTTIRLNDESKRRVASVEGSYVFHPTFKVSYDANYWRTNVTGDNESGWADFRIRPVYYPKTRVQQNLIYRTAVGMDFRYDAGNFDKGIGTGDDVLGVFAGLQLLFSRVERLSIIGAFRKSLDSEPQTETHQTELNLLGIRSIPSFDAWIAADLGMVFSHAKNNDSTSTFRFQIGKLFTPKLGTYFEALFPIAGQDVFDHAFRLTLRLQYGSLIQFGG